MMKILLLEDDEILCESLQEYLESEGFEVDVAHDGEKVYDLTFVKSYDLYIFDINVPRENGFDVLKQLKEADDNTPTIYITALTDINSISKGFALGAEDYIKKPFDPEELIIRIKSKYLKDNEVIYYKDIVYHPATKVLKKAGKTVGLGEVQQALFHELITNLDKIVSSYTLLDLLEHSNSNALRVNLAKLKSKLDLDIKNIRGQGLHSIDDQIRNQMKICSFDLKCQGLDLDFVPKTEKTKVRKLYKEGDLYSYFEVPTVDEYLLKVILPQKSYAKRIGVLKTELIQKFILYALLIALLSFLFSLYALRPLKKALDLNEEFVKDILHDINTPLSSLVINFKLFKKEIGENRKIERMESNVSTILSLQNNLKAFLDHSCLQYDEFLLSPLFQDRIVYFQTLYPQLDFVMDVGSYKLYTNKDAFMRIIDNLLSNACKYNHQKGKVEVFLKDSVLHIKDSGRGIKNVKKVFNRFYKETERGMGIGLHIVQKLCEELGIGIVMQSELKKGTVVKLDLQKVILK